MHRPHNLLDSLGQRFQTKWFQTCGEMGNYTNGAGGSYRYRKASLVLRKTATGGGDKGGQCQFCERDCAARGKGALRRRWQGRERMEKHLKAPHLTGKQRFGGCVRKRTLTHTSRNDRFLGNAHPFAELEKRWASWRSAAPTAPQPGPPPKSATLAPCTHWAPASRSAGPCCHPQPARLGSPLPLCTPGPRQEE